ncbi:MAG: ASCH domain-containing protein [Caldilineaceae bacterium]|nr:ASCH domain-containing protein [Caldilineaceae bacterium]
MEIPDHIQSYWREFEAATGQTVSSRFYEAFYFDDSEELANFLGNLVLKGIKQATAGLLWAHEADEKAVPKAGDLSVVTNWQREPLCIIETTQVEIVPYDQVSAAFAAAEGEGDGSLAYWLDAHWTYLSRECRRIGREPARDMPVVCERFRVVYPDGIDG